MPSSRVTRGEVVRHQWVKDFLPGKAREENVLARQKRAFTEVGVDNAFLQVQILDVPG